MAGGKEGGSIDKECTHMWWCLDLPHTSVHYHLTIAHCQYPMPTRPILYLDTRGSTGVKERLIQFTWLHLEFSLLFNGSMRKVHDPTIVLHEKLLY